MPVPRAPGFQLHVSVIEYYKGQHPNPVELQRTFRVSSALVKVWGERVDRLNKASSVTRPGPCSVSTPEPSPFLEHAQPIAAVSPPLPLYLKNSILSHKKEQIVHKLYTLENTTVLQLK